MPVEVIMPKVDMDMTSGRIVAWHVAEGARVEKGDALFDIETEKAAMEVEAPATGYLHHVTAVEGDDVAIGSAVAWLYSDGETVDDAPADHAASQPDPAPRQAASDSPGPARAMAPAAPESTASATPARAPPRAGDGIRATPRARALARLSGIELADIRGTAVRGRVTARDVQEVLDAPEAGSAKVPARVAAQPGPLAVTRNTGGRGIPVLLIHGFAADATGWSAVQAGLRTRPTLRIDLPNHGRSPRRDVADFADLVRQLRDAFDQLGESRVHLVGHSLGGALALALADTRPRQVAALDLIAPAGLGPEINGAVLDGIGRATRAESLAPWLRELVADAGIVTGSFARLAMDERRDPEMRAAQRWMADALFPDGVQAFDLRPALARVTARTRLIWGKRDGMIPWRHALAAPGRCALHLFDELGHMPHLEAPDEIGYLLGSPPA